MVFVREKFRLVSQAPAFDYEKLKDATILLRRLSERHRAALMELIEANASDVYRPGVKYLLASANEPVKDSRPPLVGFKKGDFARPGRPPAPLYPG